jgi:hypothetical protein
LSADQYRGVPFILYVLLLKLESAHGVPCFLGRFKAKLAHWETQIIQSSRQHRVDLSTLQYSLLNINSELMNDELKLQSNQAQQLEEYAKNSHNLYLALQQYDYDPELATSILLSNPFSPGLNQHYKH